jgi:hypothetical protein
MNVEDGTPVGLDPGVSCDVCSSYSDSAGMCRVCGRLELPNGVLLVPALNTREVGSAALALGAMERTMSGTDSVESEATKSCSVSKRYILAALMHALVPCLNN